MTVPPAAATVGEEHRLPPPPIAIYDWHKADHPMETIHVPAFCPFCDFKSEERSRD